MYLDSRRTLNPLHPKMGAAKTAKIWMFEKYKVVKKYEKETTKSTRNLSGKIRRH